jgi:hypothetical protein
MQRLYVTVVFGAAVIILSAGDAKAQLPFSNSVPLRPAVSPYLNLLNTNSSGTSNYFTQVLPQVRAREELIRQQSQINQIQRQVQRGQAGGVPIRGSQEIRGTGHETFFLNHSHFFPAPRR